MPNKLAEEITCTKLCVDFIGPYKIRKKGRESLIFLKAITMIDPITRLFKMIEYNDKKAMTIANLVETMWLVQYTWPVEITYDQVGELLGHKFKSILIEQVYGIKNKPAFPGNPQENLTIEIIHPVLGNLLRTYNIQETYVDDADPWMGILAEAAFAIRHM